MINLSRENFNLFFRVVLILVIIMFTSCLTLETELNLKNDNSGYMVFNYSLDKGMKTISNLDEDDSIVPLNLDKDYISEIVLNSPGLSYSDYSISEDERFQYISVRFDFETIEDLNKIMPSGNSVSIEEDGDSKILRQTIIEESEEIDSESLDIFKDIFKEHYVNFTVVTPKNIIYVEGGVKKSNREAIYQSSITDLLTNNNSVSWEISW